jgi:hypothetical protein
MKMRFSSLVHACRSRRSALACVIVHHYTVTPRSRSHAQRTCAASATTPLKSRNCRRASIGSRICVVHGRAITHARTSYHVHARNRATNTTMPYRRWHCDRALADDVVARQRCECRQRGALARGPCVRVDLGLRQVCRRCRDGARLA